MVIGAAPDAHEREVRLLVAAAPADGPEVVDLEAGAAVTAGPAALPIAQSHAAHDLGRQRGAGSSTGRAGPRLVDKDGLDLAPHAK